MKQRTREVLAKQLGIHGWRGLSEDDFDDYLFCHGYDLDNDERTGEWVVYDCRHRVKARCM